MKHWIDEEKIDDYLEDYELRADEGGHYPTDWEKFLIKDAIIGLIDELQINQHVVAQVAEQGALQKFVSAQYTKIQNYVIGKGLYKGLSLIHI